MNILIIGSKLSATNKAALREKTIIMNTAIIMIAIVRFLFILTLL
jgi:hypothetical protein